MTNEQAAIRRSHAVSRIEAALMAVSHVTGMPMDSVAAAAAKDQNLRQLLQLEAMAANVERLAGVVIAGAEHAK
jgi:nickel-dependent lactate racemase